MEGQTIASPLKRQNGLCGSWSTSPPLPTPQAPVTLHLEFSLDALPQTDRALRSPELPSVWPTGGGGQIAQLPHPYVWWISVQVPRCL